MSCTYRQALAWLVVALVAAQVGASYAATIPYGDFGPDAPPAFVIYKNVRESSVTDPVPPPRYNAPYLNGNSLEFTPTEFGAESAGGGLPDVFDGQLNFGIDVARAGGQVGGGLTGFVIEESGDFSLFGTGTATTSVGGGLFAEVEIWEVDGVALAQPVTAVGSTQFSADLVSSPGLNQPWGNVLFVDFVPALSNAGISYDYGVTRARVAIDDTLVAISEPSSIALIVKKDFDIIPVGEPNPNFMIPEPSTVVLLGTLLVGAAAYRRVA